MNDMNPIPGFPGYFATEDGRIWSTYRGGRFLKMPQGENGYRYVHLGGKCGGRRTVHSLIAEAFYGPRPEGMDVRHLDGNPLNNGYLNLQYGSRSENTLDRIRHGRDRNVRKTHCSQGHEYTPENTYYRPSRPTHRCCRQCLDTWRGSPASYTSVIPALTVT